MSKELPGVRTDGYVDKPVVFDNPIQKTYVHKQVVEKTGESEDEFVILEKPVLVSEVNLQKQIDEQAIGTDLKSLIQMVLRTGDDSFLNQKQGSYVDITGFPTDSIEAHNAIIQGQAALNNLDPKLKEKGLDSLVGMTKQEIKAYIEDLYKQNTPQPVVDTKTEVAVKTAESEK